MAKRGSSGISRLIAVHKPCGMSSHDVVNRCRRIFNERRVGHAGTLDPLASGVLLICVGPATRLDAYLVGHGKRYLMGVAFGISTTTDDAEGEVTKTLSLPGQLYDEAYAERYITGMVGKHTQVPPIYSAIKVGGKKAYEEARKGKVIDLTPREFEIYDAQFQGLSEIERIDGVRAPEWRVEMSVSKGTYMRSIARDMGRDMNSAAYVSFLERTASGVVMLDDCANLEDLEENSDIATLDPLRVLGIRFAFARECAQKVNNGAQLRESELALNEPLMTEVMAPCLCTTSVIPSSRPPQNGELIGVIVDNRLKALYEYHESEHRYVVRCMFSIGVERGRTV